jgi:succinylglutamate desuccinylase
VFIQHLNHYFDEREEEEEEERRGRAEEEEVSLGLIMTNTEIKFHISLFTLSSSSVSQFLLFNLLQSLYCSLSSVLVLCLQFFPRVI